jgi:hypothetical protein
MKIYNVNSEFYRRFQSEQRNNCYRHELFDDHSNIGFKNLFAICPFLFRLFSPKTVDNVSRSLNYCLLYIIYRAKDYFISVEKKSEFRAG